MPLPQSLLIGSTVGALASAPAPAAADLLADASVRLANPARGTLS